MEQIVIVAAKRTAIGSFLGSLKDIPAHMLGAEVIKSALEETAIKPEEVDSVIMGQVLQTGCGQNPARQAAIAAGLSEQTPALTLNLVCGSGLKSVMMGAQQIMTGDAEIVIAGGQESMSQSPHFMHTRDGLKFGDAALKDSMIVDGLWDAFNDYHMGITAENVAEKYQISREAQDAFAYESQSRAQKSLANNVFDSEITAIQIPQRKGDAIIINKDEHPRLTELEKLATLKPAFKKDGTVTAANASGLNDGAAVVVLMTASEAEKRGLEILARIKSQATVGVNPEIMGIGPVPATQKALKNAGWSVDDLDLVEANEAFAAQALAVSQELGLNPEKTNVNGGAIALGHPIGASGTRVLVTLVHEMKRRNAHKGLATLCVGGGQGVALAVER